VENEKRKRNRRPTTALLSSRGALWGREKLKQRAEAIVVGKETIRELKKKKDGRVQPSMHCGFRRNMASGGRKA